jgi:hypothetical protein
MLLNVLRKILPLGFCLLMPLAAQAQDCSTVEEMIVRLRPPSFGNVRSWDIMYGDIGYDRFSDIVTVDNENVVVAGDYTKGADDTVYKPMLVKMDYRARTVWETRETTDRNNPITRLAKTDKGFTVLGEMTDPKKGKGLFIAHYSPEGKQTGHKPIFENNADLDAVAVVPSHDGKNFIVASQYHNRKNLEDKYGLVYKLSPDGKIIWRRAYRPGIITFFHNLQKLDAGGYIASGQIRIDDGRLAGWGVRLDENGAIQWQNIYPRGKSAALRSAASLRDGGFVFSGEVEPSGGGRKSSWLMAVDVTGEVVWQRYYTGDYNYIGYDVLSYDDGRIDLLSAGRPLENRKDRPHVFILTVSPRGYLMDAKAFVDGQGALARRMILGPNDNRFFVGTAQTTVPDDVADPSNIPFTFDAWLVGVPGLDRYEDPCLVNPLDDLKPPPEDPF